MNHQQHAEASERRLEAVQASRLRLGELADEPSKTPAMWAEVSELKLNLQLAYDGAGVHANLALYGAVLELIDTVRRRQPGGDLETV